MENPSHRFTAFFLCIMLAACGGGSNSAIPESTPIPTPAMPAINPGPASPSSPSNGMDATASPTATPPAESTSDATQARFKQPIGIAIDAAGNLYIADAGNNTVRKISSTGQVTTLAGSAGVSGKTDGTGAAARFSFLKGLAVDKAGNVYAVDDNAVRRITPTGIVATLAGAPDITGNADGPGAVARFNHPWGIALDAAGNIYIADTDNYLVRKITPVGEVSTHAGTRGMRGTANGSTASATFLGPRGIAINTAGRMYLTDWFGPPAPNIPEGSTFIRRIDENGVVSTVAGNFGGETGPALFRDTFAIAADAADNVYVAAMRVVRRVSPNGTVTMVAAPSDRFQTLEGIAIVGDGTLYVVDSADHTVSRITQAGTITLVAGQAEQAGSADVP